MLTLCMNPGKICDWSLLQDDIPIASSDFRPYDTERETLDAFDALVELAKADAIPFEYNYEYDYDYDYNWDGDLFFVQSYENVNQLKVAFDEVLAFLKGY